MSKRTTPNKESRLEDDLFDPDAEVEEIIEGFPTRNELVVATIMEVFDHGCYVALDEYDGQRAYVHISELSRTWVKNIRVHVREGQRIVAKVLRVDPYKNQVDLSIKRVPEQMKKLKLLEAKRGQTANTLFNMILDQIPENEKELADEVKNKLIQKHELLYYGLEFASTATIEDIKELGINDAWAKTIHKIASENIISATVEIKGIAQISIPGGEGVKHLKEALTTGRDEVKESNTKIKIYSIGSPRYTIEVTSEDYKIAERALDHAVKIIEDIVVKHDGTFSFER